MDVSVQREADGRLLVRLAADKREVNVRLSTADVRALVASSHWREGGTLRAGGSAGVPVSWASGGEQAKLLIGHGDETQDDAITIPFRVLDEIIKGAIRSEVPSEPFTQSYERPPTDNELVGRLRAGVASVPDLHEAYLVARRTVWPEHRENVDLGVLADAGGGRNAALRIALAPFSPPKESAPLRWVAYADSPVPDNVRGAGIRLA